MATYNRLTECLQNASHALSKRRSERQDAVERRNQTKANQYRDMTRRNLVPNAVSVLQSNFPKIRMFVGGGTAWAYQASCWNIRPRNKREAAAFVAGNLDLWVFVPDEVAANAVRDTLKSEFLEENHPKTVQTGQSTTFFAESHALWVTRSAKDDTELLYVEIVVAPLEAARKFFELCTSPPSQNLTCGSESSNVVNAVGRCLNLRGLMLTNFIMKAQFVRRDHKAIDIDTIRYEYMRKFLQPADRTAVAGQLIDLSNDPEMRTFIPDLANSSTVMLSFCSTNFNPKMIELPVTKAFMPLLHQVVADIANDPRLLGIGGEVFLVGGHALRFFTDAIQTSNDIDAKFYVAKKHHNEARRIVRKHMQRAISHLTINYKNEYPNEVPTSMKLQFVGADKRPFAVRYDRQNIESHPKNNLRKIRLTSLRRGTRSARLRDEAMSLGEADLQVLNDKYEDMAKKGLTYDQHPIQYISTTARVREQRIVDDVWLTSIDLRILYERAPNSPGPSRIEFNLPILDVVVSERPEYQPKTGIIIKRFGPRQQIPVATLEWWCYDLLHMYEDPALFRMRSFAGKTDKDWNRLTAIMSLSRNYPTTIYTPPDLLLKTSAILTNESVVHHANILEDTYRLYDSQHIYNPQSTPKTKCPYRIINVRPFLNTVKERRIYLNGISDFQIGERHLIRLLNLIPPTNGLREWLNQIQDILGNAASTNATSASANATSASTNATSARGRKALAPDNWRCECLIKRDGTQCKRPKTKRPGQNHRFCYQHQKCVTIAAIISPSPTSAGSDDEMELSDG